MMKKTKGAATDFSRATELKRRASDRGEELISLQTFRPAPPGAPRSLDDIPEPFRKPAKPPGKS